MFLSVRMCFIPFSQVFSPQFLVFFRTPMVLSVKLCFIPYSHVSVCETCTLFRTPKYLVCSSLCFFVLPWLYLVQPSFFRIPLFLSVILLFSRYSHVCSLQYLVFFRTPMVLSCKTELFPYSHVSVCESVLYSVLPSI